MTAITLRMNNAIPGAITRPYAGQIISQEVIDAARPPTAYGIPVKLVAGKVQPLASGDAVTDIYGVLVRPYPTQDKSGTGPAFGGGLPPVSGLCDVLRVGFIGVVLSLGTTTRRLQASVRVTAHSGNTLIGALEDGSDATGVVAPTNWRFTGPADANGNVELSVGIPG